MADFDVEAYLEETLEGKPRSSGRDDGRKSSRDDRDRRRRSRSRDREDRKRSRKRTPSPDPEEERRKQEEKERLELDRDLRTAFVMNLHVKAEERDVYEFFIRAGKVRDVRLIKDPRTRRPKGVGYVEFYEQEAVQRALMLTGQLINGHPVVVQASQAEKNRAHAAANAANSQPMRLYVGQLHPNITEDDLSKVFAPFGDIDYVTLQKDEATGESKGFAFLQYKKAEDAKKALTSMNGLELAGKAISVGLVNDASVPGAPGVAPVAMPELDDDADGGLSMSAQSRAQLMARLQRAEPGAPGLPGMPPGVPPPSAMASTMLPVPGAAGIAGMAAYTPMQSQPAVLSPCFVLSNMFDPATETEPDFHLDIQEDVEEECGKAGPVKHVWVNKESKGQVYVKMATVEAGKKAMSTLHGRWFAGKMITAEAVPEAEYNAKFNL